MRSNMIFQIQSYSIHDGPGIRTTVFVKGCPLRCLWCHNPESQKNTPEVMWVEANCSGCGACMEICPQEAIQIRETMSEKKLPVTDRTKCNGCGACVSGCRWKARRMAGKTYQIEEVMKVIRKDAMFYPLSGGGVTVSGGEPLASLDFTVELLGRCKEEGYHTAIETCGYASEEAVRKVLPYLDLVFLDLKAMDPERHKELTGVENGRILQNARIIAGSGVDMVLRIPMIRNCNADEENIRLTGEFISKELGRDIPVQLLPYHNLGISKEEQLERTGITEFQAPSTEEMEHSKRILEEYGLPVQIGGSM
ncbi:MAG: glycyl-radical enzyme activating protein [Blautia sp.]|nr:glycyl-radical enzyme activating protein [Blautia sp.]